MGISTVELIDASLTQETRAGAQEFLVLPDTRLAFVTNHCEKKPPGGGFLST
jgi:hypothetical protein